MSGIESGSYYPQALEIFICVILQWEILPSYLKRDEFNDGLVLFQNLVSLIKILKQLKILSTQILL